LRPAARFARHLRSNVVAYCALFVALGGTSYAAVKLPAGSVGTKQLAKNSVTSSKVKNGSLLASDFASGQLLAGANGAHGPQGIAGVKGAQGSQGPAGSAGERGPAGEKGAKGEPGLAGADGISGPVVVARIHLAAPVTSPDSGNTPVALTGDTTWTQEAGHLQQVVILTDVTGPDLCSPFTQDGTNGLQVHFAGTTEGNAWVGGTHNAVTSERPIFPPSVDTERTMTAEIGEPCTGEGQTATVHQIEALVLDTPTS
jgi:hypothetical protein